ncbi:MAG: prolipoprotein diacylglyceryl transferase [Candidatus Korobacteraceae bacterium]
MFPELLHLGRFALPTYGMLVAIGVTAGLLVSVRMARRQGLNGDRVWDLGVFVVLAAIVGAKALLIINDFSYYSQNPGEIFSLATLQAGGVFYGGLIAALLTSVWYMQRNHMPWLRTADAFAPGLALGHAIGRIGCFAAGCCFGRPTDSWWGVVFHSPIANQVSGTPLNVALHPTQLLEAAVELANFFLLAWMVPRKKFEGQVIGSYLFLYGIARFFMEFLRGDPDRGSVFGGAMSGTQLISIGMVILGGILWMRRAELKQPAVARAAQ